MSVVVEEEEFSEIQEAQPEPPKCCFDKIPQKIIMQIIAQLPFSDKKSIRQINHEWLAMTNEFLTINFPKLNDDSRQEICSHVGTVDYSHVYVTKLTDNIESWLTTKFHHGPKIISIVFENPEISTDNMIWLLTQCYSVKELQFTIQASTDEELKIKRKKLEDLFQNVETMKAINICSRTLRSVVIKCNLMIEVDIKQKETTKVQDEEVEGKEEDRNRQKINSISSGTITLRRTSTNSFSTLTDESTSSSTFYFDCAIFKNCRLFQSFIIIQMPYLKLKNLDELPLQIGHAVLQPEELRNNNNNIVSYQNYVELNIDDKFTIPLCNSIIKNIGFIDFSGPVSFKEFQYIFRLPKIKKYCSESLVSGQDIWNLLSKVRGVSKLYWSNTIQHYQVSEVKIKFK